MAIKCLKNDGLFLLHAIGTSHCWAPLVEGILPNGLLPYHRKLLEKMDGLFVLEDWQNIGISFSYTLRTGKENFEQSWLKLKAVKKFDKKFYRMCTYSLSIYAAALRSRKYQVWLVVMLNGWLLGEFDAVR